jgi:hypothetical protein
LDEKRILRARRGLYVLPELPPARAVAAAVGGVVSHLSAAVEHGLPVLVEPARIHVTLAPSSKPPSAPQVTYHDGRLPVSDVRRLTTTVVRRVLDCAATQPFAEALAVADSALREGFVRREDLLAAAGERRGPGRRAVLRVAEAADGDAANPFESALRAAVLDAGVRGFVPQLAVTVNGPGGRSATVHVDLGDQSRRIALEADSFAHHGGREALRDDCRRYDELVRAGWLVLRFAWEHVLLDPAWVAEVVRDTCASWNSTRIWREQR